jgi:phosphoribosylamine--glycine ligase
VVKADGLAAGKGVVVAADVQSAHDAVTQFMEKGALGVAGKKIVIEEFLDGAEYSVLAAVCVTKETIARGTSCIKPFVPARDHKRLKTGNEGPNTGGMGAIAPVPDVTDAVLADFTRAILEPTLKGLIADSIEYQGFIFFGVMLTKNGSKLLEYNARLGDPETQAVLPLMQSGFLELCESILDMSLVSFPLAWKKGAVCAPVLVSGGYPGAYKTGFPITVATEFSSVRDIKIFVSGGAPATNKVSFKRPSLALARSAEDAGAQEGAGQKDSALVTSGGRVLTVSAYAPTADEAWEHAYNAIGGVSFVGMYYRADIGRAT